MTVSKPTDRRLKFASPIEEPDASYSGTGRPVTSFSLQFFCSVYYYLRHDSGALPDQGEDDLI